MEIRINIMMLYWLSKNIFLDLKTPWDQTQTTTFPGPQSLKNGVL